MSSIAKLKEEVVGNPSGLMPLGRAVLVVAYEPERKNGAIVLPDNIQERASMLETRAVVIATGPLCWEGEPEPRAFVGDKVFITKFAGVMAKGPADGKIYRLINDRDIFCRITEEKAL